jgi:acetyl-CoA acyltransferase 1
MSHYDMMGQVEADFLAEEVFENPGAQSCLMGMGITSENVAAKFGVTREVQDAFALKSHAKAVAANKAGFS